jgi:pyrroloquinoline quinone biosynthesis protein B
LCIAIAQDAKPYVQILGIAQDGGYPHMGCVKKCCAQAWQHKEQSRFVVALALIDSVSKKWWLFEATPDIKEQLHYFRELTKAAYNYYPDGIFITHAHIGHYAGLMQLGREVINAKDIPVYTLPKLKKYLEGNGPWSQLVTLENIRLVSLEAEVDIALSGEIKVRAFTVPHRDEYSETAGYKIHTGQKKYLFIPDINKWDQWDKDIIAEVQQTDIALLDATFYDSTELGSKRMREVSHPLVIETMNLFKENKDIASRIYFIHFNHTNPLMSGTKEQKIKLKKTFHIAEQGQKL